MSGKKLLVADDSLTIQKVIRLALSHEGYDIQTTSDGNDTVQQILLNPPDIILIDISLPNKNAFEVKREINIHLQEGFNTLKFILMSSAFEKVDELQVQEVGFHGRLIKPFDPIHLREILIQVLQQTDAKKTEKTTLLQFDELMNSQPLSSTPEHRPPLDEDLWSTHSHEQQEDPLPQPIPEPIMAEKQEKIFEWNIQEPSQQRQETPLEPSPREHFVPSEMPPFLADEKDTTTNVKTSPPEHFNAELELLVKNEVKTLLEKIVQKTIQEEIPNIAEKLIKQEIRKMLVDS